VLLGAFLEVGGERYGGEEIRRLHNSTDFPPARGTLVAMTTRTNRKLVVFSIRSSSRVSIAYCHPESIGS